MCVCARNVQLIHTLISRSGEKKIVWWKDSAWWGALHVRCLCIAALPGCLEIGVPLAGGLSTRYSFMEHSAANKVWECQHISAITGSQETCHLWKIWNRSHPSCSSMSQGHFELFCLYKAWTRQGRAMQILKLHQSCNLRHLQADQRICTIYGLCVP